MDQIGFADAEYAGKSKKTRREVFLEEMELVVPWKARHKLIEPFYPVAGRGRRPYPLESILRVHLMQNWFALSDPAMEEALYEITSLRAFLFLNRLGCTNKERGIQGGLAGDQHLLGLRSAQSLALPSIAFTLAYPSA